jgi:hypothetical protein
MVTKKKKKPVKKQNPAAADPAVEAEPAKRDPNVTALNNLWGKEGTQAGDALIKKLEIEGDFLGRVNEEVPGQREYLDKLRAGLGGYSSPEYQAQREQAQQGIANQYQTAASQLAKAQARGKVYGAAGAAQQSNLIRSTQDSKNNLEQQLMVQNINEMQNRLNNYGNANAATEAANLERQKTNMGNVATETATRAETITGAGGLALEKAQNKTLADIQRQGIEAINGRPSQPAQPAPKKKKKTR